MCTQNIDILKEAIQRRLETEYSGECFSNYRIDVILRCLELGDIQALRYWLNEVRSKSSDILLNIEENLVFAAESVLKCWEVIETEHGEGALLNYPHRLKNASVLQVGISKIENAARYHRLRDRDFKNPMWAVDNCSGR